jgi:hypothetical protein
LFDLYDLWSEGGLGNLVNTHIAGEGR